MTQLDCWLKQIGNWYQQRKHDQGNQLEALILSPPDQIWGPHISDQQSKAIACWLDGCLRIYDHSCSASPDKAFQYLQFAYSKLQQVVANPDSQLELKDWCMKRMQHLTVLSLEFCNQQPQSSWQTESHQLIEAHVQFMAAHAWNETRNNDQGIAPTHH